MDKQLLVAPQLGEGLTKVKIVALYKQVGDIIHKDEVVYAVETDKATVDIETPFSGELLKWLVRVDDVVDVGAAVAQLSAAEQMQTPKIPKTAIPEPCDNHLAENGLTQLPRRTKTGVFIPPRTRAYCKQIGLQAHEVEAISASEGLLTPERVDDYLSSKNSGNKSSKSIDAAAGELSHDEQNLASVIGDQEKPYVTQTLSPQQTWLNTHFKRSRQQVVQATLTAYLDLAAFKAFGQEVLAQLSDNDARAYVSEFQLFAYLVSRVLMDFPKLRSVLIDDNHYREYPHCHLGVAVNTEHGELVTAVVDDADLLDAEPFLKSLNEQVDLAISGKDQASEHMPFVLSYMGGGNVLFGSPLLVSPAVATLFFSIPDDERVKPDGRVYLSFAFEHRLINGMDAADFLNALSERISGSISTHAHNSNTNSSSIRDVTANINNAKLNENSMTGVVCELLAKHLRLPVNALPMDKTLFDIGVDSIAMTRLKFAVEQRFDCDLSIADLSSDTDLNHLVDLILGALDYDHQITPISDGPRTRNSSNDDYLNSQGDFSTLSEAELDEIYDSIIAERVAH